MAGAKETPRQKMVGLMYLVLMALLALNVSKAVLDAFVAIEDNIQKACIKQLDRGNGIITDLKSELADNSNPQKKEKVKYILSIAEKIDNETAKRIEEIDKIKMEIIEKSGENVTFIEENSNEAIIWKKYSKNDPLRPARLNLNAIQAKDQYDVPMHEIIGEDLSQISGKGKDLWSNYNQYRNSICHFLGTYKFGDKSFELNPKAINDYQDNNELSQKVDKMLLESKINKNEDYEVLKQLYMDLSKNERIDTEEAKNIHWIGKTFDHSPLVAALASLTSFQQEYLTARATALAHLKGKVSTGEYSFNKVMALAYAPPTVNQGEEFEVKVLMAAYDSDNQPTVDGINGKLVDVKDGYGILKFKAGSSGEMNLKGKVAIRKKSGEMKSEDWNTKVVVMKPMGTISIPAYNILYRNYPNVIEAVASGYDETKIVTSNNLKVSKKGSQFVVEALNGRQGEISVYGIDKKTNKSIKLATSIYKIAPIPKAGLYFGSIGDGEKASKSTILNAKKLFNKYDESIPLNINFITKKWTMEIVGFKIFEGFGDVLDQNALNALRSVKSGQKIRFTTKYVGANSSSISSCEISIQ